MLCIDLYCGLGGWAEGFLSEGWEVIGFDIERHRYPRKKVGESAGRKVQQEGVDFQNRNGSSASRSFNYANQVAWRDAEPTGEWDEYPGQLVLQDVTTLHGSQFRNADVIVASPPCSAYSYRAMPWGALWVENGRMDDDGAPAGDYGCPDAIFNDLFRACFRIQREASEAAGRHIPMVVENVKGAQQWVGRAAWHYGSYYLWGDVPALMPMTLNGVKQHGSGPEWFDKGIASVSSSSLSRKAASAQIAKIPFPLASWIAKCYTPCYESTGGDTRTNIQSMGDNQGTST